ncbi:hypothetical protein THAOC_11452 [Thalassiosira oceanica]|uniref:Uncharacterized protein n=1 Tax=Thalassiosira oceanica TaxID=159749 RepID=K0T2I5_THAOC|nr:hypothetical protein THAOC_11452 [Thalassiosira oceanica]|eukprot:EJK67501.1 hypothetical protein THAOC_11452 [Thalassiosira oceanica]
MELLSDDGTSDSFRGPRTSPTPGGGDDNAPETASDSDGLLAPAALRPRSPDATFTELLCTGACEAVAGTATRHPVNELAGKTAAQAQRGCWDWPRCLQHHGQACIRRGVADSDAIQAEERHIPEQHLVAKSRGIPKEGRLRGTAYVLLP